MNFFEKNVGKLDRTIRIIFGILIIAISFILLTEPFVYLGTIFGILLILTGIIGTCSLYTLIGINTCKLDLKVKK